MSSVGPTTRAWAAAVVVLWDEYGSMSWNLMILTA